MGNLQQLAWPAMSKYLSALIKHSNATTPAEISAQIDSIETELTGTECVLGNLVSESPGSPYRRAAEYHIAALKHFVLNSMTAAEKMHWWTGLDEFSEYPAAMMEVGILHSFIPTFIDLTATQSQEVAMDDETETDEEWV